MDFERQIRAFIRDNFMFGDDEVLPGDTSLTHSGVIDSVGVLEVIMFLEETYDIKVEDDEALPENLDTVDNLVSFMERKVGDAKMLDDVQA